MLAALDSKLQDNPTRPDINPDLGDPDEPDINLDSGEPFTHETRNGEMLGKHM